MPDNRTAADISEQLFQAIDAIVMERIRVLKYDKTVIATIIENDKALYGKYKVTTDDNITFYAYADTNKYILHDKVYVRIPEGDYTKQKIITGKYIPEYNDLLLTDETDSFKAKITAILNALNKNEEKIQVLEKKINNFSDELSLTLDKLNGINE